MLLILKYRLINLLSLILSAPSLMRINFLTRSSNIFFIMLVFRVFNSIFISTFFDPDEYYQSLEVAHNIVFKRGYVTWEWRHMIRGYAHPLIFVFVYKVIQLLKLQDSIIIIWGPKIVQGLFAALTDFFTFLLANRIFGLETARFTV